MIWLFGKNWDACEEMVINSQTKWQQKSYQNPKAYHQDLKKSKSPQKCFDILWVKHLTKSFPFQEKPAPLLEQEVFKTTTRKVFLILRRSICEQPQSGITVVHVHFMNNCLKTTQGYVTITGLVVEPKANPISLGKGILVLSHTVCICWRNLEWI